MRLDELTIGEFKNLRDLRVDFDEGSPYTVLVGENGAGKSNLIEALSLIFRNLDLDQEDLSAQISVPRPRHRDYCRRRPVSTVQIEAAQRNRI